MPLAENNYIGGDDLVSCSSEAVSLLHGCLILWLGVLDSQHWLLHSAVSRVIELAAPPAGAVWDRTHGPEHMHLFRIWEQ